MQNLVVVTTLKNEREDMNREFLKNLGIEEEMIEKIMAEHGKAVQANKSKVSEQETEILNLKEQLSKRDNDIEELKNNANDENLKEQYSTLQEKYEKDVQDLNDKLQTSRMNSAVEMELLKRKALNNRTVIPLIDFDTVKLTEDGLMGLEEQLTKIQNDNPFLFDSQDSEEQAKKPNFAPAKNPTTSEQTRTEKLEEALGIIRKA